MAGVIAFGIGFLEVLFDLTLMAVTAYLWVGWGDELKKYKSHQSIAIRAETEGKEESTQIVGPSKPDKSRSVMKVYWDRKDIPKN
jgi:hypothetical protein